MISVSKVEAIAHWKMGTAEVYGRYNYKEDGNWDRKGESLIYPDEPVSRFNDFDEWGIEL